MITYGFTKTKAGREVQRGEWIQPAPGRGAFQIVWLTPEDPAGPRIAAPKGGGSETHIYPNDPYTIVDPESAIEHIEDLTAALVKFVEQRPEVVEFAPADDEPSLFYGQFVDGSRFILTLEDA